MTVEQSMAQSPLNRVRKPQRGLTSTPASQPSPVGPSSPCHSWLEADCDDRWRSGTRHGAERCSPVPIPYPMTGMVVPSLNVTFGTDMVDRARRLREREASCRGLMSRILTDRLQNATPDGCWLVLVLGCVMKANGARRMGGCANKGSRAARRRLRPASAARRAAA